MQIQKKIKTTATSFVGLSLLLATALFSCNDSSTAEKSSADSTAATTTTGTIDTSKAVTDTLHKTDSTTIDTTKGGQNPPPKN